MYPVSLNGINLVLREFETSDLDGAMEVVGDPAVTNSLSFDTRSREQQAERLAADIERARSVPRPDYYLAAIEKSTGTLVGFARIGLIKSEEGGEVKAGEIGVAIRKDRWRQGYAMEACSLILDFAFGALGLHRVQARCAPSNTASQAGLLRLGFKLEAHLRDDVFTNGAWRDSLQYASLDEDWRNRTSDTHKPFKD